MKKIINEKIIETCNFAIKEPTFRVLKSIIFYNAAFTVVLVDVPDDCLLTP